MNWSCPGTRLSPDPPGVRSTRVSVAAHGLAGPSAEAGARSNGRCHDTLVASAVASSQVSAAPPSAGNRSIRPAVCRLAHASRSDWAGTRPVSTWGGSPACQDAIRALAADPPPPHTAAPA